MIALLLAAACALYSSIGEDGRHYPAAQLHHPSGWPYYDSTGALVPAELDRSSRFPVVILSGGNALERPAVPAGLRDRNPDIIILAWVSAVVSGSYWQPVDRADTLTNCLGLDFYRACARVRCWQVPSKLHPGETYNPRRGIDAFSWCGTNWANHAVAYAWVRVLVARVVRHPMFDGVFVDMPHFSILWSQSPRDSIDFTAAGFPTSAAFDSSWRANVLWAAMVIRRAASWWPGFRIVFNGVNPELVAYGIAGMRENWPNLWGGTWGSNMTGFGSNAPNDRGAFGDPYGGFFNVLLCNNDGTPRPDRERIMRFAVGSAALCDAYACFTAINDAPASDDRSTYWIPEMEDIGAPWGPAYELPDGKWRRDFEWKSWVVDPVADDAWLVSR